MKLRQIISIFLFLNLMSVNSQIQINFAGSAYGFALNKEALEYDKSYLGDLDQQYNQYNTSKYLSLGLGYLFKEQIYLGGEIAYNKSLISGTQGVGPEEMYNLEWHVQSISWNGEINSWRFGIRSEYNFFKDKIVSPYISFSGSITNDVLWKEKGTETYNKWGGDPYNVEYEQSKGLNTQSLGYDFRVGVNFRILKDFFISCAVEFSGNKIYTKKKEIYSNYPIEQRRKLELAVPITLRYQFRSIKKN
jgi:hypothetical protein